MIYRSLFLSVIFPCLVAFMDVGVAKANPLDNYAWKKRPVVVFAPSDNDNLLSEQQANLRPHLDALKERDIVLIEVYEDEVRFVIGERFQASATDLRRHFGAIENRFGIVLIGKDTGVKLHSAEPVTARALFDLIDAMPMRQREMVN